MDFWSVIVESLREDANVEELKGKFESWKTEQLNGVISNKEKLLEEKKVLQAEYNQMKEQMQVFQENEITPEVYNELVSELETLRKSSTSPEDIKEKEKFILDQGKSLKEKELNPIIEKLKGEKDTIEFDKEQYKERYQRYRVDNEVKDVLKEMNADYDPIWLDGFLNKSKFEYNDIEDKMEIELYAPDTGTTLPLEDWKKIFPNSTMGKKMIKAPKNVGGGSRGGGYGSEDSKSQSPEDVYANLFHTARRG